MDLYSHHFPSLHQRIASAASITPIDHPGKRVARRVTAASVREQWMQDIFSTAMEGGVNYWARVRSYNLTPDGDFTYSAVISDVEDPSAKYTVDRSVIAKGMSLARAAQYYWSTEKPPLVWTEDSDWDYDAGDADAIVQLGLFGEIVYG